MHCDVVHEVLRFFRRRELEPLQILSRSLREAVDGSTKLALHYIALADLVRLLVRHCTDYSGVLSSDLEACPFQVGCVGEMTIDEPMEEEARHRFDIGRLSQEDIPFRRPRIATDDDISDLLRRLSNAHIKELRICVGCGPVLRYLREHPGVLRCCHVAVLSPNCGELYSESGGNIDLGLLDVAMREFRPTTYAPPVWKGRYVSLVDHPSVRDVVTNVRIEVR